MTTQEFIVEDLSTIDYKQAWDKQKAFVQDVIAGGAERIILCEHPPTITLGRMSHEEHLLFPRDEIEAKGVALHEIDRGGDVTLHAPGQLVVYPILHLRRFNKDLKQYLHKLEQVTIDLLKDFGIVASGDTDQRGVWVGRDKIASIGIGVSKWVTYHGLAININNDLDLFRLIKPCGLDVQMTSIQALSKEKVTITDVKNKNHFVFG